MRTALFLATGLLLAASIVFAADREGAKIFAAPPAGVIQPQAAAIEIVSKDDATQIAAVIKAVIAAGFTDAAGATLYAGKIAVTAKVNPEGLPPLPTSASNMQMTDPKSKKTTYQFQFDGLHAKLADGSWIFGLSHHFKPGKEDSVDVKHAAEVKVADLTATAAAEHPLDVEKGAAKWLEALDPASRPRAAAALKVFAPVTMQLHVNQEEFVPAMVVLDRAGWSDAEVAAVCVADSRSRQFWQLRAWTGAAPPYDPTGEYDHFKKEEADWTQAHPKFTPEAPAVALRRGLFRWCRGQLMVEAPEDALLPLDKAAACAKAMVDPGDPQGYAAKIDALLAGAKLPVGAPEKADLVARLQSWEARPRRPRMIVGGGGPQADGSVSISTSFVAPVASYTPEKKDLDALIALLGDERPSRFFDFNGPRTVGDNALRAVAMLLEADPRKLAGQSVDKPWTASERKAAATAVQKWWTMHRKEHVEK
ncbi:MAG: hypothetical protein K8T91_26800 [Planctomycetes bacterium]|nr:hypothetical protein [Planctomycetota bacterium]